MKKKIHLLLFLTYYTTMLLGKPMPNIDSLRNELNKGNLKGNDSLIVLIYNGLAQKRIYSDIDSAYWFANKALDLSKSKNYNRGLADANGNLFFVHHIMGDYAKALDYAFKMLDYSVLLEDQAAIASAYANIAMCYGAQQKPLLSIKYYLEAYKRMSFEAFSRKNATICNNLSAAYIRVSQYDSAALFAEKCIEIGTKIGYKRIVAGGFVNLASIEDEKNRFTKALKNYQQALDIASQISDTYTLAYVYNGIASCYYKMDKNGLAEKNIEQAYLLAKEQKNIKLMAEALLLKVDVKSKQGKHKEALELHKEYAVYKDSLVNESKNKAINNVEFKRKKAENLVLNQKNILLMKDSVILKQSRNTLFIGITLISLICGAILYAYLVVRKASQQQEINYKKEKKIKQQEIALQKLENEKILEERKRLETEAKVKEAEIEKKRIENQRLRQEIDHKHRQLTSQTLHLVQKNETLLMLKKNIEEEYINTPSTKKITKIIDQNISLDRDWKNFKLHFDEVHEGFFDRLLQSSPTLTSGEVKLSAYLRMQLSSKEIAVLLNIAPKGVEKKRYRLRKKLEISSETDLNSFMLAI